MEDKRSATGEAKEKLAAVPPIGPGGIAQPQGSAAPKPAQQPAMPRFFLKVYRDDSWWRVRKIVLELGRVGTMGASGEFVTRTRMFPGPFLVKRLVRRAKKMKSLGYKMWQAMVTMDPMP